MSLDKNDFEFIHFESIDSTNNYAKALSNQNKTNKIIIADTQTAGRTTKKQCWISPKGNLYFSIILSLDDEKNLPEYSFISALSIVESIKQISYDKNTIKIKWPNDILLNKQKLCGILIEKENDKVIIGIGINVISSPDVNLTRYPTTNLKINNINTTPMELSKLILKKLLDNINLRKTCGFNKIISKIMPYMYKFNETIHIETNGKKLTGIFCGLNETGALLLKTDNKTQVVFSGEMTKENFI